MGIKAPVLRVEVSHPRDVLWAMEEGAACAGLSAVVGEIHGAPEVLSFTATKRLALRSEASGVPLWLIRSGDHGALSAARERWRVSSLPSDMHPWNSAAPGQPVWEAELFRARGRHRASGRCAMTRRRAARGSSPSAFPIWRWTGGGEITRQQRTLPGDDVPVVLAAQGTHGPVVYAISAEAVRRGVFVGARVVDVQAIHPDLHVESADATGDVALLDRVALWARRWCPWTVRDGGNGIVMDVTGAAHLFGGEAEMLRDIGTRFAMQGLAARLALAPTRGAAQMLARLAGVV